MNIQETIIIAAVTTFLGWIVGYQKNKADTKKNELDAVGSAVKIWRELSEELKREVVELKRIVEQLKLENEHLKEQVKTLDSRINNEKN